MAHLEVLRVLLVELGADKEAKDASRATALHYAAGNGHAEAIKLLVQLGVNKEAKDASGGTPLHHAAYTAQVEAIKALVHLGAQIDAQMNSGDIPLKTSIRKGHHQAAQVLRELERTARARKEAATSERPQQAAEQANRNAAELIEEEEREQAAKVAAQSKVRGVELAPVCGVSDAVSLAHGWVACSEVPAAAFLWRR
jgi:ankyrin repeat protein